MAGHWRELVGTAGDHWWRTLVAGTGQWALTSTEHQREQGTVADSSGHWRVMKICTGQAHLQGSGHPNWEP